MEELLPVAKRGKFFVVYGPNNIGKSTQTRRISNQLIGHSKTTGQLLKLKYPIYGLNPTGPIINGILRSERERVTSEVELQALFAQNRRDFQPKLIALLNAGITVLAEDYTGTGIAWGLTRGIPLKILLELNDDLIDPDLAILLDGKRFSEGKETGHRNESAPDRIWQINRAFHLQLAEMSGWQIVDASQSEQKVTATIWNILEPVLIEP